MTIFTNSKENMYNVEGVSSGRSTLVAPPPSSSWLILTWSLRSHLRSGENQVFSFIHTHTVKWSEAAQSCPTLCDPIDCSLPGSSLHGILQARVLEWVAISFSTHDTITTFKTVKYPSAHPTLDNQWSAFFPTHYFAFFRVHINGIT